MFNTLTFNICGIVYNLLLYINNLHEYLKQRSSVSIVSAYGLDDQAIEVRSPSEANGFFL
jgi:hypothetical protein